MEDGRQAEEKAVQHIHCFEVHNPFHAAGDRCECGTFRYELMGPFARRRARLAAYDRMSHAFAARG